MAAMVWMLAGVSSTTRTRSFMSAALGSCGRSRALQQRLRLAEGVALHVSLEFCKIVPREERPERLAMGVQEVRRGGIELAQLLVHLRHEAFAGLRIDRRGPRRAGGRPPGADARAQPAEGRFQPLRDAPLQGPRSS